MPAVPKDLQELMSLMPFEVINNTSLQYYRDMGGKNPDPEAFFDPTYKKVYLRADIAADPVKLQSRLFHEYTHKIVGDISDTEAVKIYQDVKKLGLVSEEKLKEIMKYPSYDRNKELIARFTETFPNEVIRPTTATGNLINREFAKKYNWDTVPTSLFKELELSLKRIKNKESFTLESKRIVKLFVDKFKNYLNNSVRQEYIKTKNSIARQGKIELDYTLTDEAVINGFTNSKYLWESYSNLDDILNKKVNSILSSSFQEGLFNPAEARKRMLDEIPKLSKTRVNSILRNEYANIQNLSSENTYKQLFGDEGKYVMIGPNDNRTAESTKRVKARQGSGVSIDELKQIIREEADPRTYTSERPFIIHINTRHRLLKVA